MKIKNKNHKKEYLKIIKKVKFGAVLGVVLKILTIKIVVDYVIVKRNSEKNIKNNIFLFFI